MKRHVTYLLNISIILSVLVTMMAGCGRSTPKKVKKPDYSISAGKVTRYRGNGAPNLIIPAKINGEAVTRLDGKVFIQQKATQTITIPTGVTKIGAEVFNGCPALTEFIVAKGNKNFKTIDGVLFTADETTLIAYPQAKPDTEYAIPTGTKYIANSAFYSDTIKDHLKIISFPTSLLNVGDRAFWHQNDLNEVIVDPASEIFKTIDGVLFTRDGTKLVLYPAGKRYTKNGDLITTYAVPDGVLRIGNYAMMGSLDSSIKKIILPDSIEKIGNSAFVGLVYLENINLPEGLQSIGNLAFSSGVRLSPPDFPSSLVSIGSMAFNGAFKHKEVYLPATIEKIGRWAFSTEKAKILCEAKTKPAGWHRNWAMYPRTVKWGQ